MPFHAAVRPGIDVSLGSASTWCKGAGSASSPPTRASTTSAGARSTSSGLTPACGSPPSLGRTRPQGKRPGRRHRERQRRRADRLPVYSLYGSTKKPSSDSISSLDALILDLPDVGCRYWTILYTMSYVLEAAAQAQIPVIVLDRPNPITGLHPEGNLVEEGFSPLSAGTAFPTGPR